MSEKSLKLKAMQLPPTAPVTVKLEVLEDLTIGTVFYSQGDTVEVSPQEAAKLIDKYEEYFEVQE